MKRVLLSGGTGFVGSNLLRRLLDDGHEVALLVRPEHDPWRIRDVRGDLSVYEAPLTNGPSLLDVVETVRPDWVFHLAAYGAYPEQRDVGKMVQTNVVGTINLVQACVRTGFEAFVNAGSSSEYGFKDHAPTEDEWLEPNSHYAVTKASATLFCRYAAQEHRMRIPTLRLYSVYGPFEEPTRLMPTLVVNGLRGKLPRLADPNIARDFVYVDDVVDAFVRAADMPLEDSGAVYNVGTGVQTRLTDVVEVARRQLGVVEAPKWGSLHSRSWDTDVWVAAIGRIQRELGWEPRHSVEEGFRRLVSWFQGHVQMHPLYQRSDG